MSSSVESIYIIDVGYTEVSDNLSFCSILMSPPPVWNLKAVSLIQLFDISSLVLLTSRVPLSVLSFPAFGPFS